jgi:hypothetical protein
MSLKIGDTVSYQDLTGEIVNIFVSPSGKIIEVKCPANKVNELDVMLWIPESEILNNSVTSIGK